MRRNGWKEGGMKEEGGGGVGRRKIGLRDEEVRKGVKD